MAQPITREFLSDVLAVVPTPDPVVAFGVQQAEPGPDGDLRRLFPGRAFVGADLRPGPGVDRVEDLRALRIADGRVGTAICLDTLEGCGDPVTAVRELHRVLQPRGGVCVLSCGTGSATPGRPDDLVRFAPEDLRRLLAPYDDVWIQGVGDPENPRRIFAVAIRGGSLDALRERGLPRLQAHQRAWEQTGGTASVGPARHPPRQVAREVGREGVRRLHRRLRGRR